MSGEVKLQKLPNSRVKLTFPITVAEFKPAFDVELAETAKSVKIQGFRPGKAPDAKVLAEVGRERVEAGALDRAINAAYFLTLKAKSLTPVSQPQIMLESYVAPADDADSGVVVGEVSAEVDVLPDIELKNHQKISVKAPAVKDATDADVDEVIQYLRKQRAQLKDTADGVKLAKGMWADIGFEGALEGVKRDDMASKHHALIVGDGTLIPGFEEEMIGMTKGESKTFSLKFPKDYQVESFRAKSAEFTVTIHEMKDMVLPDLDPTFADNLGHKTVEELEKAIKSSLQMEREGEQKQLLEEMVVEELLKQAKFETPQSLVDQEESRLIEETKQRMGLNITGAPIPEHLMEQIKKQSAKNVQIGLIVSKVAELEGLTNEENAMRKAVDKLIEYATKSK